VVKTNTAEKENKVKAPCPRSPVKQLIILNAWEKQTSTGKSSIFGQARDETGQKYQIVCAVKIAG
jgi:hypothetical protein